MVLEETHQDSVLYKNLAVCYNEKKHRKGTVV